MLLEIEKEEEDRTKIEADWGQRWKGLDCKAWVKVAASEREKEPHFFRRLLLPHAGFPCPS